MQIYADLKGKVALDDVNCRVKCHGNTVLHFHFIAHYLSVGEFFAGDYFR